MKEDRLDKNYKVYWNNQVSEGRVLSDVLIESCNRVHGKRLSEYIQEKGLPSDISVKDLVRVLESTEDFNIELG